MLAVTLPAFSHYTSSEWLRSRLQRLSCISSTWLRDLGDEAVARVDKWPWYTPKLVRFALKLELTTLVVLVHALVVAHMRSKEYTPRAALTRSSCGTGALLLRVLMFGALVPAARASCSSAPTCPAHVDDRLQTCYMPGSPMVSNWQGHRMWSFMGNGLYTIGKISKDETNCCYDVEVQAFLIPILSRDGTTRVSACMLSNFPPIHPFVPGALPFPWPHQPPSSRW